MSTSRHEPTAYHIVHRRAGHVMVAYDSRLYVWGGYMELPHTQPYTLMTQSKSSYHSAIDVWMYDPLLDTWTRKMSRGNIPWQLSGSCAAVHDQHMYLFGGWTSIISEDMENNLNYLWRLHLPTLTWELLDPEGIPPYPCDKAACWVHKNRFYVFGGFGPSRSLAQMQDARINFVHDNVYHSGWIDQLVYYDIESNRWVWPETRGPKPSPRAAHAADVTGDRVYIFGGRFKDLRMNELHCLDLNNWTWSGNLTESALQEVPEGRSWHTFNFVSKTKAVVYGGFNTTQQVLKDVWVLDVTQGRWELSPSVQAGPVLWHTSAVVNPGEVIFYGGIRNNLLDLSQPKESITDHKHYDHADDCWLMEVEGGGEGEGPWVSWVEVDLAYDHGQPRCWHTAAVVPPGQLYVHSGLTQPYYITIVKLIDHAEELLTLKFSPPRLQRLVIEACCRYNTQLHQHWHCLPQTLQHILEVRSSSINTS